MKLMNTFYLIFVLLLGGCVGASNSGENVIVEKVNISLNNKHCLLTIDNDLTDIKNMKPACYFVKNSASGKTDIKYYKDINAHVLLIVGTISPKDKEYPLTLKRNDCGTQIQALIVKNKNYTLSRVTSDTLICAGLGTDEKIFYILSHP